MHAAHQVTSILTSTHADGPHLPTALPDTLARHATAIRAYICAISTCRPLRWNSAASRSGQQPLQSTNSSASTSQSPPIAIDSITRSLDDCRYHLFRLVDVLNAAAGRAQPHLSGCSCRPAAHSCARASPSLPRSSPSDLIALIPSSSSQTAAHPSADGRGGQRLPLSAALRSRAADPLATPPAADPAAAVGQPAARSADI